MRLFCAAIDDEADGWTRTTPGEIVVVDPGCPPGEQHLEGCPCRSAWIGLTSDESTSLALVDEVDVTLEQLADALVVWHWRLGEYPDGAQVAELAKAYAEEAAHWPAGCLVRRSDDRLVPM